MQKAYFYDSQLEELVMKPINYIPYFWIKEWRKHGNEKNVIDRIKICFDGGCFIQIGRNKDPSEKYIVTSIIHNCIKSLEEGIATSTRNLSLFHGYACIQDLFIIDVIFNICVSERKYKYLSYVNWMSLTPQQLSIYKLVFPIIREYGWNFRLIQSDMLGLEYDNSSSLTSIEEIQHALLYHGEKQFYIDGDEKVYQADNYDILAECLRRNWFIDIIGHHALQPIPVYVNLIVNFDCVWMWILTKHIHLQNITILFDRMIMERLRSTWPGAVDGYLNIDTTNVKTHALYIKKRMQAWTFVINNNIIRLSDTAVKMIAAHL